MNDDSQSTGSRNVIRESAVLSLLSVYQQTETVLRSMAINEQSAVFLAIEPWLHKLEDELEPALKKILNY